MFAYSNRYQQHIARHKEQFHGRHLVVSMRNHLLHLRFCAITLFSGSLLVGSAHLAVLLVDMRTRSAIMVPAAPAGYNQHLLNSGSSTTITSIVSPWEGS